MASVLSQMLHLEISSFSNRSIFLRLSHGPWCRVHPGRWLPTRGASGCVHFSFRQPYGPQQLGRRILCWKRCRSNQIGTIPQQSVGQDAVDFGSDHQISPTQPMPGRSRAPPTALGQGSPSEVAAERFLVAQRHSWGRGKRVTFCREAGTSRHLTSVTDSHPVTGRFHRVVRQASFQSSHSLCSFFLCMSEINKDVASVSSLKNGTLRHLFISMTMQRPEASRKRHFVRRSSSWTLAPKKAAEEVPFEGPPVWPRGSVLLVKENSTRLAELETRSVGSQTSSEVGTPSVGSQTSFFTTDLGTLQQWPLHSRGVSVGITALAAPN